MISHYCVYMCVVGIDICLHVCGYTCTCVHMHEEAQGWCWESSHWGRVSQVKPKLTNMVTLTSQPSVGIRSLCFLKLELHEDHDTYLAVAWVLGFETLVFMTVQSTRSHLSSSTFFLIFFLNLGASPFLSSPRDKPLHRCEILFK